ncbi:glycosyltransferase [Paenibacillus sp. 1P07SE]|uniref:glycosyltransferase n=1 Tax=Paenibacillus sp. 1P07SE TaxID=3132209 RepID=UPI0039A5D61D
MRTIIFPPMIDWDWMTQRPQQLMKQFARSGCRVFYCNRTSLSGQKVLMLPGEPGLQIVYDHERWLREDYAHIRASSSEVIVWCSKPDLAASLNRYEPDTVIYDCVDDLPQWYAEEETMVRLADGIVCTSARLDKRLSRRYPDKPRLLLRNGYDEDMGLHVTGLRDERMTMPGDLPSGEKPLIGFVGAWAPWVDAALLSRIAHMRDIDWEVVVIGAELGRRYELAHLPNIHYLGQRPHRELAAYIAMLDICLVPFLPQQVTLAANPVKVYEYLAAGKPVVSTDLPECREMGEVVEVGRNHDEVLELIARRLKEPGSADPRRGYALCNSWRQRAETGLVWLEQLRGS